MALNLVDMIKTAVTEMREDEIESLCKEALDIGVNPSDIMNDGLMKGMSDAVKLYEKGIYYLPEVLVSTDTFNRGLKEIEPYLREETDEGILKIVIGVVEGDSHDIGKNIVKAVMKSMGFKVYDLGRDVLLDDFLNTAEKVDADIIAVSALMTTTMDGMRRLIEKLRKSGKREKYKVMIGGGVVSKAYASLIGADIYSRDALEAVEKLKMVLENKVRGG